VTGAAPRLPTPLAEGDAAGARDRASATPRREVTKPTSAPGERVAAKDVATLRDLQLWMYGAITGPEPDVAAVVTDGPRLGARDRFEVYRSGYVSRLVECLVDDYPVLAAALGEDAFEALATAYIARHPSRAFTLNPYGQHMSAFCREAPPPFDGFDELRGFAADLASLEWALVEVLHAEIAPALDLEALKAVPPEKWPGARLVRSEALRVCRFDFPVNTFFQAVKSTGGVPPIPAAAASATAVYLHRLSLWRMELTPAMARVLEALARGDTLGDALGTIAVEADDAARAEAEQSVMIWFREWVSSGFFARVEV
jgi:hypothetical protein